MSRFPQWLLPPQRMAMNPAARMVKPMPEDKDGRSDRGWCAVIVNGIRYPSVSEAARENGVSNAAVYKWIERGKHGARYEQCG